ncbi:MAG TPA: hypothetical protein VGF60_17340 [Xanthobacteraceae bacterium]|jgi:hypothetical protein
MPPLVIPPLIKVALGALGASAAALWLAKEIRQLSEEFDRLQAAASNPESDNRKAMPTLRRDPRTGEWRVR